MTRSATPPGRRSRCRHELRAARRKRRRWNALHKCQRPRAPEPDSGAGLPPGRRAGRPAPFPQSPLARAVAELRQVAQSVMSTGCARWCSMPARHLWKCRICPQGPERLGPSCDLDLLAISALALGVAFALRSVSGQRTWPTQPAHRTVTVIRSSQTPVGETVDLGWVEVDAAAVERYWQAVGLPAPSTHRRLPLGLALALRGGPRPSVELAPETVSVHAGHVLVAHRAFAAERRYRVLARIAEVFEKSGRSGPLTVVVRTAELRDESDALVVAIREQQIARWRREADPSPRHRAAQPTEPPRSEGPEHPLDIGSTIGVEHRRAPSAESVAILRRLPRRRRAAVLGFSVRAPTGICRCHRSGSDPVCPLRESAGEQSAGLGSGRAQRQLPRLGGRRRADRADRARHRDRRRRRPPGRRPHAREQRRRARRGRHRQPGRRAT